MDVLGYFLFNNNGDGLVEPDEETPVDEEKKENLYEKDSSSIEQKNTLPMTSSAGAEESGDESKEEKMVSLFKASLANLAAEIADIPVSEVEAKQNNASIIAPTISTEDIKEEREQELMDFEVEASSPDETPETAELQASEVEASSPDEAPETAELQVFEVKTKEEKEREKEVKEKLVPYVEAALFLAGRPISELELAEHLNSDRLTIRWALRRLKRELQEQNSALEILNPTKDRWVLQLCEEFSRGLYDYIEKFIPKEAMLSREEIDTLTEIAYRQPITSSMLVKILTRPTIYDNIKTLQEKGFIILEKQERTNLLRTSAKFADIYGFDTELRNLKIQLVWRLKKRAKLDESYKKNQESSNT